MDTDSTSNGHNDEAPRVKFGPRETQDMPLGWAEHMLAELAIKHHAIFSKLLSSAALGK